MSVTSTRTRTYYDGSNSLEDDVERRLADIKYKLVHGQLDTQKQRAGRVKYHEVTGKDIYNSSGDLDVQLQLAKMRHEDLKRQLERERQLAEKIAERPPQPLPPPQPQAVYTPRERGRSPRDRRSDRIGDLMEMMMVQNNQVQNMIMNQTMLKQAANDYRSPPPPNYPMMMPMPMYHPGYSATHPGYIRPKTPKTPVKVKTPKAATPKPAETKKKVKRVETQFPFPGNYSQQKLRRLAYAAFFLATLNRQTNENKFRPSQDFLFDLKLKEIVESLHRIYKAPDGQLYTITISSIMGAEADELTELLSVPKTLTRAEEKAVSQEVSYALENTVFQVTDIMPATGILGTHRKSGLFEMIRSGNRYPSGYFYTFESDMLEFTADNRVSQVSDNDAVMLIMGIFLVRALIETLYLKTSHYGMIAETTPKAERNIKLMSTIIFYLYRKIVGQLIAKNQGKKRGKVAIPELPPGLREVMYTDQEIRPILKLIKKSLDYSENLLSQWGDEYVLRLRAAAF